MMGANQPSPNAAASSNDRQSYDHNADSNTTATRTKTHLQPIPQLQVHGRSFSTTSNTTVHEATSDLSHQSEPLLHPSTDGSEAYAYNVELRNHPGNGQDVHEPPGNLGHDRIPRGERGGLWETIVRKRIKLLGTLKRCLEATIGVWALFNAIRYYVAYPKYISSPGQAATLALALSSSLSLLCLICATLISVFKLSLIEAITPRASVVLRKALRSISSALILVPAVLNVAFLSAWRSSQNQELSYRFRCYIDIDVLWSISTDANHTDCIGPPWGIWLTLALVRLSITTVVLVSYHIFSYAYGRTRRMCYTRRCHSLGLYSPYTGTNSAETSPVTPSTLSPKELRFDRQLGVFGSQHRPSRSTLASSNVSSHSHSPSVLPYPHPGVTPRNRSGHSNNSCASSSEDDNSPTLARLPPGLDNNNNGETWSDVISEHFRTLITQINQEMDEVVELSRRSPSPPSTSSSSTASPVRHKNHTETSESRVHTPIPSSLSSSAYRPGPIPQLSPDSPYCYNLPPVPPTIGYNEFGQPYPPEEPLPILNGFIRRMPTIESMGSREMGSITSSMGFTTGGSMYTNRDPKGGASQRSTMTFERRVSKGGSAAGSEGSRPDSFGTKAELLASLGGTSEVGELLDRLRREEVALGRGSPVKDSVNGGSGGGFLDVKRAQSPAGTSERSHNDRSAASRSSGSYYTATSGSLGLEP
ncbi:hypothetical protein AMATHDRAFT_51793 [Amanita thiersii Skay4041]|uniref:Uncharacterized protein n=1 Tax=Amanita thiersii Skay4041 TaxID=703135 RepID=A0A2A9NA43_9AGAR|nr:hypothetical protein AMATHDRAFT_51793 [Amanita thiersii Skay4041]